VVPTSPTHAAAALTNNSQNTVFFVVVYAGVAFRLLSGRLGVFLIASNLDPDPKLHKNGHFYLPEFATVFSQIVGKYRSLY
jgi:hypothetical protein